MLYYTGCTKIGKAVSLIGLMMHHKNIMLEINEMRMCSKFIVFSNAIEGGRI